MTNRELETRYTQMKLTWKNLVNANVELVDENKYLKEENGLLHFIIKEVIDEIKEILEMTKEQDKENVNLIDRLENLIDKEKLNEYNNNIQG